MQAKRITTSKDLTGAYHYAILLFRKHAIYHEGDERSRSAPGHGYPAYTEELDVTEVYGAHELPEAQELLTAIYAKDPRANAVVLCNFQVQHPRLRATIDLETPASLSSGEGANVQ